MKRIIAGILFVIFVVPLCTTGLAAEPSLSDPMAISVSQLKEMIEEGSADEKVSSLKLLCNRSAADAILEIEKIMETKEADKRLFDAAINFLPRLIGEENGSFLYRVPSFAMLYQYLYPENTTAAPYPYSSLSPQAALGFLPLAPGQLR